MVRALMSPAPERLAVFLHSGEYDRVHQGLSIAVSGASAGRSVEVYFFWWALERLIRDDLDAPDFGPGREELSQDFVDRGFPTLRQLLEAARSSGRVRLFACSGSLGILDETPAAIATRIDELVGWSAILERTAGVTDRFLL
jgi:peroxiredoxin family protein